MERSKAKNKYFEDVVRNKERNRKKETSSSSSSSLSPHSSISQKILSTSSIDINKNNPITKGPPPRTFYNHALLFQVQAWRTKSLSFSRCDSHPVTVRYEINVTNSWTIGSAVAPVVCYIILQEVPSSRLKDKETPWNQQQIVANHVFLSIANTAAKILEKDPNLLWLK